MPERTGLIAQMRRGALEYRVLALLANRERYGFELVQNLADVEGIPIGANRRVAPHLATTASRESGCMPLRHSSRSGGVLVGHRSALGGWEMTGAHADQIVDGHLKCLEASLASLPSNRRPELTSQISDTSRKRGRSSRRKRRRRPDHPGSPGPARRDRHRSRHYAQGLDRRTWANRHAGPLVDRSWRRDFSICPRRLGHRNRLSLALEIVDSSTEVLRSLPSVRHRACTPGCRRHCKWSWATPSRCFARRTHRGLLLPLGTALYLAAHVVRRLHWLARTDAFIGADGPPGSPSPQAGQPGCGGFYGTAAYASGTPLLGKVPVNVGVWDGRQVTKPWGPDCPLEYGPGLVVKVQGCRVESEADLSMIISIQSDVTALTAPAFAQATDHSWMITPDGKIKSM